MNETTDREVNGFIEFTDLTYRDASKDLSSVESISESQVAGNSDENGDNENKKYVTSISVSANSGSLTKLSDWLDGKLRGYHCAEAICNQIMLANEEIFLNIASYAYPITGGEVTARIGKKGNMLAIQYEDEGIPFNPLEIPAPEINVPLEERKIGGLGIFLVRKMMDKVKYKRVNNKNTLTLYKIIS